jgi:hypothetical protein
MPFPICPAPMMPTVLISRPIAVLEPSDTARAPRNPSITMRQRNNHVKRASLTALRRREAR